MFKAFQTFHFVFSVPGNCTKLFWFLLPNQHPFPWSMPRKAKGTLALCNKPAGTPSTHEYGTLTIFFDSRSLRSPLLQQFFSVIKKVFLTLAGFSTYYKLVYYKCLFFSNIMLLQFVNSLAKFQLPTTIRIMKSCTFVSFSKGGWMSWVKSFSIESLRKHQKIKINHSLSEKKNTIEKFLEFPSWLSG